MTNNWPKSRSLVRRVQSLLEYCQTLEYEEKSAFLRTSSPRAHQETIFGYGGQELKRFGDSLQVSLSCPRCEGCMTNSQVIPDNSSLLAVIMLCGDCHHSLAARLSLEEMGYELPTE